MLEQEQQLIALLDLLCEYYDFRWENGYSVYPRIINIAAIEPNRHSLKILNHFIGMFKDQVKQFQIHINVTPINEKFPHPECIELIKKNWKIKNNYTVLVISSNVILWTQNYFNRAINFVKRCFGLNTEENLGVIEAKAFDDLLSYYKFKQAFLLDIATRNQINNKSLKQILSDKVNSFIAFMNKISKTIKWWKVDRDICVNFLNAQQTYYGQQDTKQIVKTYYFHTLRGNEELSDKPDLFWEKVIDYNNLELAWARTRQYMLRDDLVDEIEIRLADFRWKSYLERLRAYLIFDQNDIFDIKNCVDYSGPKNQSNNRPRYLLRMIEQIISAAISQANPQIFVFDQEAVFGNRLNIKKNEFFYKHWFDEFSNYMKSIKRSSSNHEYIIQRLDIKSYYTNISQKKLYNKLCADIGIEGNSQLRIAIKNIIVRNLSRPHHEHGFGIPQSGITAGLWSNSYLDVLDKEMNKETDLNKIYTFCRYADDMTLVTDENNECAKQSL